MNRVVETPRQRLKRAAYFLFGFDNRQDAGTWGAGFACGMVVGMLLLLALLS